jgi:hypothetical protein
MSAYAPTHERVWAVAETDTRVSIYGYGEVSCRHAALASVTWLSANAAT